MDKDNQRPLLNSSMKGTTPHEVNPTGHQQHDVAAAPPVKNDDRGSFYPTCCASRECVTVVRVAFVAFFAIGMVLNPTETFGVIKNDYTGLQSEYDMSLYFIDHWCLKKGDNDYCRCEDPLEPNSRIEFKTWNAAHKENKMKVEAYQESTALDVAFVGEGLVEEMNGRWMGYRYQQGDEELKGIGKSFRKQFKREMSGIEGVALGIAGDTSPNVLWRLLNGELPTDFNPRVWWLVLGMNDLGRMQCSEEVVVLGILRVVFEIRTRKPDAHIVINSLLPMADLRGDAYPQKYDYKDAFARYRKKGTPYDNPALYAGTAVLPPPTVAQVRYVRPMTTTTALRNRHYVYYGSRSSGKHPVANYDDDSSSEDSNEESSEAEKKAEKRYIQKIKKDPVNPKLNLEKKFKARDAKTLFLRKNRLPLWTSIHAINKELRTFADKHDGISFFDATDVFAERTDQRKYVLQSDKISIRGHPTQSGFEDWERAIATKLKKILEKDDAVLAKHDWAEEKEAVDKAKTAAKAAAAAAKAPAAKSSDDEDKKSSDEDAKKKKDK